MNDKKLEELKKKVATLLGSVSINYRKILVISFFKTLSMDFPGTSEPDKIVDLLNREELEKLKTRIEAGREEIKNRVV